MCEGSTHRLRVKRGSAVLGQNPLLALMGPLTVNAMLLRRLPKCGRVLPTPW